MIDDGGRLKSIIEHGRAQHLINVDMRVVKLEERVVELESTIKQLIEKLENGDSNNKR
jgi:predicted ATP-grasp superfamily ATP-dependent carboligase